MKDVVKMTDAEFAAHEAALDKEFHAEEAKKMAVAMKAVAFVSKLEYHNSWSAHWAPKAH